MTLAPNETQQENERKNFLMREKEKRGLTLPELYELRDLCRVAASHLVFATHSKK